MARRCRLSCSPGGSATAASLPSLRNYVTTSRAGMRIGLALIMTLRHFRRPGMLSSASAAHYLCQKAHDGLIAFTALLGNNVGGGPRRSRHILCGTSALLSRVSIFLRNVLHARRRASGTSTTASSTSPRGLMPRLPGCASPQLRHLENWRGTKGETKPPAPCT